MKLNWFGDHLAWPKKSNYYNILNLFSTGNYSTEYWVISFKRRENILDRKK